MKLQSPLPSRPQLPFWQIWNMCFGFLGLQFGFALQNANVSRIFQTLGASVEQIPALWIAAPLTGLLVQPVIGYWSDRTWTRLGRRRPYFLCGAVLAAIALVLLPRAPTLGVAAALLWLLDASINVSMEPFRAFVGDQLAPAQRPSGYAMQSFFIGIGAVVASLLPYVLARFGVRNHADTAHGALVPDTVQFAFTAGAVVLFGAVAWTVLRTREYPPERLRAFADADAQPLHAAPGPPRSPRSPLEGAVWAVLGLMGIAAIRLAGLDPQLYLVSAGAAVWGLARLMTRGASGGGAFGTVMRDLDGMPLAMRRLIPVQFFSWLALFAMWIYTTSAVALVHYGSADPSSDAYNAGANWVGVLFAAYNGFAAIAAMLIPAMVRRFGLRWTHLFNVCFGAASLASFLYIGDPRWLLASMVGIGFAWASILSLPYALLSDSVPAAKMGLYMGIFNFFIVIPQLVAASVLGVALKWLFGGAPIDALAIGAVSFLLAGISVLRVPEPAPAVLAQPSGA
jgi:maltose/moltooligosaccharide transporter